MTVLPFLAVSFIMNVVAVLFVICCIALVLIILVQKGRGGGLSAAFGGSMAGGILGSKTGDFLTWVTIVLVGIFLSLAVIMAKYYKENIGNYGETAPPPLSQTTNQIPTSPVTDIDTATSDTSGSNPIEESIETTTEISIPAEQALPESVEPLQDTAEPVQDTTDTINEANIPNG